MSFEQQALTFNCGNAALVGILTLPRDPGPRGVLLVVGGPQYRVGSHRQFLLLARELGDCGIPVLRFDYRGMGDSDGEIRTFEFVEDDLAAATDAFFNDVPSLKEVVIWGLCDAASVALMYACHDPRITGLALANPWVRTPEGLARAVVKHYYVKRLFGREFWEKTFQGRLNLLTVLKELTSNMKRSLAAPAVPAETKDNAPFPDRMALGLEAFSGHVLLLLSGNDLTAQEFVEMTKSSALWQRALDRPNIQFRRLPEANHTFSRRAWRDQISRWTIEWVKSWGTSNGSGQPNVEPRSPGVQISTLSTTGAKIWRKTDI